MWSLLLGNFAMEPSSNGSCICPEAIASWAATPRRDTWRHRVAAEGLGVKVCSTELRIPGTSTSSLRLYARQVAAPCAGLPVALMEVRGRFSPYTMAWHQCKGAQKPVLL
jgi:hypothetical protein